MPRQILKIVDMDFWSGLEWVAMIAASIGAAFGFMVGLNIAERGSDNPHLRELAHQASSAGASKIQFASFIGVKTAGSFAAIASIGYLVWWFVFGKGGG